MAHKPKKITVKIILDVVMCICLVLLYKAKVLTLTYHEVMGLGIAVFFLVHCLLNRKWIAKNGKKLFSKSIPVRTKVSYWLAILLVICFLLIIISGIFMSKIVFKEFWESTGLDVQNGPWRNIHYFCSALSLILVGAHVGLYWDMVKGWFGKKVKLPAAAARAIGYVLLTAILVFGVYSMPTTGFTNWLTFQNSHSGQKTQAAQTDTDQSGEGAQSDSASAKADSTAQATDNKETGSKAAASEGSSNDAAQITGTQAEDAGTSGASEGKQGHGKGSGDATADATATASRNAEAKDSAATTSRNAETTDAATANKSGTASNEESSASTSENAQNADEGGTTQEQPSNASTGKGGSNSHGATEITVQSVLLVIAQFTSILGVFAFITYLIDHLARRKKKAASKDAKRGPEVSSK